MKILILSCNTGGGHNAAAGAIQRELLAKGEDCVIKNALDFTPRIKKDITEAGHSMLYKWAPELYGETYEKAENKNSHLMLYYDYARFAPSISAYVNSEKFDVVICVHVFPAMMLSAARRFFNVNAKLYFVATDYSVAPGLEKTRMDSYFVPIGCVELFREKLPKANIIETGIPIDSRYYENIAKADARKELGIRDDAPVIIIEAGSIGCGPIKKIAETIKIQMGSNAYVIVLCGKNNKLREELAEETTDAHFLAIGFTDKVLYWTKAADVIISKAGGLSITEIVSVGVPLICMNAVPGLEQHNLETMVNWGCAVTTDSVDEICKLAMELCTDEKRIKEMLRNQHDRFHTNAVNALINNVCKEYMLDD